MSLEGVKGMVRKDVGQAEETGSEGPAKSPEKTLSEILHEAADAARTAQEAAKAARQAVQTARRAKTPRDEGWAQLALAEAERAAG